MPFTPYHFGPGLLVKAAAPERFSLAAYALTEVAVDAEVLIRLAQGKQPVHGPAHTLLGAVVVGLVVGAAVAVIGRWSQQARPGWADGRLARSELRPANALTGGLVAGISASLLDALMHPGVAPFAPWFGGNPLLGAVSAAGLQAACVVAGVLGVILLARRYPPARRFH
jgi:hypothetical protein